MSEKKDQKPSFYEDNRAAIKTLCVTIALFGAFAWANLGLNIFSPGQTISSSEMNQNFQKLELALQSDIVLKNSGALTIPDPNGCKFNSRNATFMDVVTGSQAASFDPTTGILNLATGGLFEIVKKTICSGCSKRNVYFCADVDQPGTGNCLTESKMQAKSIGEFNSNVDFGLTSHYVEILPGVNYKIVLELCGAISISNANDIEIYIRKVR